MRNGSTDWSSALPIGPWNPCIGIPLDHQPSISQNAKEPLQKLTFPLRAGVVNRAMPHGRINFELLGRRPILQLVSDSSQQPFVISLTGSLVWSQVLLGNHARIPRV